MKLGTILETKECENTITGQTDLKDQRNKPRAL